MSSFLFRWRLISLGVLFSFSASVAQYVDDILTNELDQHSFREVIITFRQPRLEVDRRWSKTLKGSAVYHQLKKAAETVQAPTQAYLRYRQLPYTSYTVANALWCRIDRTALSWLMSQEDILFIEANPTLYLRAPTTTALSLREEQTTWGITKIKADSVWAQGYRGKGVVVGGQDTGIEWDNPYLKAAYRGWDGQKVNHNYHWYDAIHSISPLNQDSLNPCGLDVKEPCDDDDHGTHTVGTMVGKQDELTIGVAPEAKFIGCRCMERGWGSPQTYLECFEWFLAPRDTDGLNPNPSLAPDVINNSWGCPFIEGCDQSNFQVLNQAVINLKAAGIVVVASAGNSGPGCFTVNDPAAMFEAAFSVGAIRPSDTIASFSSRGPVTIDGSNRFKPNISAPGVRVTSTLVGGILADWNGTSMSGPHVAGAVALLLNAVPELRGQVEEIEQLLETTARPMTDEQSCASIRGTERPNALYGYGIIDVQAAILAAKKSHTEETSHAILLTIYPNPTSGSLLVQDVAPGSMFRLFDVHGRQVMKQICYANTCPLDLNGLLPGFYYLQMTRGNSVKSAKIVKI